MHSRKDEGPTRRTTSPSRPLVNTPSTPNLSPMETIRESKDTAASQPEITYWRSVAEFLGCAAALQLSYLVWGVMQELIMNTKFTPTPSAPTGMFPSAAFCVFSNRFLAIIVAAIVCRVKYGTVWSAAPLLAFTPCSLSNTISSWSQYQALAFVSFSIQTLFKSTKVIPVMLMGYLLKRTVYTRVEYFEALAITAGVSLFSFANTPEKVSSRETQLFGFFLLCLYVASDSFTSQWQSKLFGKYGKIDHFHMMFGVNVSSIVLSTIGMLLMGDIPVVYEFLLENPTALWYNILTAITSTTGQIAIFYTIRRYGPIVFTVIMTTRQMLSIVLSTVLFAHPLDIDAAAGAVIVFLALFHSAYRQYQEKTHKNSVPSPLVNVLFPASVLVMGGLALFTAFPTLGLAWFLLYVGVSFALYAVFFMDVAKIFRPASPIELEPVNSDAVQKLVPSTR